MNQNFSNNEFNFSGILCSTFGHKFIITNNITNHIKEYQCKNCNKEFTNVFSGGLEILNFKNRKANTCLSAFFKKKQLQQAS
jgi:hypothetical protein|tara:strand:+ start:128 stop:373 length:246 start_codon:yes stop_codon:yes gene_type:complete